MFPGLTVSRSRLFEMMIRKFGDEIPERNRRPYEHMGNHTLPVLSADLPGGAGSLLINEISTKIDPVPRGKTQLHPQLLT
jgi:hypothetical protein